MLLVSYPNQLCYLKMSYLQRLRAENRTEVVPMGGVHVNYFNAKYAIGTEGLCACSVVIIASRKCAIIAHIPPLPLSPSEDPNLGMISDATT